MNERPQVASLSASIAENSPEGAIIGSLELVDGDFGASLTLQVLDVDYQL